MSDNRVLPGPLCGGSHSFKEAVCIDTNKVYDTCKDKDCLEDLRVFFSRCDQAMVDRAINVKAKCAEVIFVFIDVEPVPFNSGFFSIDIKFFFKITFDVFMGVGRPQEVKGLATFDKKVILFGGEGQIKKFCSEFKKCDPDKQMKPSNNKPVACVEVVDPVVLDTKVVEKCDRDWDHDLSGLPDEVCGCFDEEISGDNHDKKVLVTLGVFSIVKLERNVQLLIPCFDFCIPEKVCISANEDPCELFERMKFPTDEFFPGVACATGPAGSIIKGGGCCGKR